MISSEKAGGQAKGMQPAKPPVAKQPPLAGKAAAAGRTGAVHAAAAAKPAPARPAAAHARGPSTPATIGKYAIRSVVALGGMGRIYKAVHPTLKRDVIIKELLLRKGDSAVRERFKREATILLELNSPYVVRLFDYFSEGRKDYIVLEFVDGLSLDKLLEKQYCLSPQLALLIFLDACYGLQSAHRRKIVHRDIKPGNILISRRGEVKLSDFGIAGGEKEKDSPVSEGGDVPLSGSDDGLTKVGTTLGTPAYMSPEQLDDSRSVDERADIYSMGVMLYQMTTGDRPYKGDMAPDTIEKIRRGQYIPPEQLNKSLPLIVRKLVRKMMQPDPRRRYQTIEPVIKKIKRYLSRYDRHEIRKELATIVVSANPGELQVHEPKNKTVLRICAAAAVLALLVAAGFKGIYYRTLLRPWYVPVTLQMQIPVMDINTAYTADLPAKAFFFHNRDDIPEVKGINFSRVFAAKRRHGDGGKNDVTLVTKAVSLKPGDYRIKIVSGPYILWQSVTVTKGKPETLSFDFLKTEKRSLSISMKAMDYDTGEDISEKAQFQILTGNKWSDLSKVKKGSIASGQVIHVRAVADGYEPEAFGLAIDWYQDSLDVTASLHRKAADEASGLPSE